MAESFEEDRPPIIVKGGSLIIQSGDEKSSNPKHKKGKPWKWDGQHWKQDHHKGKDVKQYSVAFQGGGGSCSPAFVTEVRVTYQMKSGEKVVILIGRAERAVAGKPHEPVITSSKELKVDNTKEQPTLTLSDEGSIVAIAAGSSVCTNPVGAKLHPIK